MTWTGDPKLGALFVSYLISIAFATPSWRNARVVS